jgi:mannitol 2-dehydrogenase
MTVDRAVVPLSDANLRALPASVSVPSYDRRALRPGVVHMSVGSFHRSHQAVYFDDLANRGELDWGIVGLGLRRPRLRAALSPQDGLYTVAARGSSSDEARVVGAMTRYLFAPEDRAAALEALADERTAVVTLTVTAAAYDDEGPSCALDYLVAALDRRRRAGRAPFTVLSCDNLPANGGVARAAVVARASRRDARLAEWIDENVAFPDSMVDRFTPRSSLADRE